MGFLSNKNLLENRLKDKYLSTYLSMTLFTRGIRPQYKNDKGNTVTPTNYLPEYDPLFTEILYRHPNEEDEIHQWRRASLRIEKAQEPLLNAISRVSSVIFEKDNFEFSCEDESTHQYFKGIKQTIKDRYMSRVEDPNGVLCVIDNHDGIFENEPAQPIILFVPSKDIKSISKTSFVFEYNKHYHYLDANYYLRFDLQERLVFGYKHEQNRLPFVQIGGKKVEDYYLSDFQFFVGWAMDYLQQASDDKIILKNASYPIPIMAREECSTCSGTKRIKKKCDSSCTTCSGSGCLESCSTCHGTGQIGYFPGRKISFDPVTPGQQDKIKASELMYFASPPIEPATHSLQRLNNEKEGMEKALHVRNIDSAQSGEAKALDMADLTSATKEISDSYYDVWNYIIGIAVSWLNFNREVDFSLEKPVYFEMKTTFELAQEYQEWVKMNASKAVLDKCKYKLIYSMYPTDRVLLKKEELAMFVDVVYHDSIDTINKRSLDGSITEEQIKLHYTMYTTMDEYINRTGVNEFLLKPINELSRDIFG